MPENRTHYEILKVAENASLEDIRAAFKIYFLKYHPSNHFGKKERAERFMQVVSEAFSILSDPIKKQNYDALIAGNRKKTNEDPGTSFGPKLEQKQPPPANIEEDPHSDELPFETNRIIASSKYSFLKHPILAIALTIVAYIGWSVLDQVEYQSTANRENINAATEGYEFNFENKCRHPITLAVRYQGLDGDWYIDGWWDVGSGESVYLEDENGKRLTSKSSIWYYFARTSNGTNLEWKGKKRFTFNGVRLSMIEIEDIDGISEWSTNCD
jgi:curved DNA-binding protein CbpA